MCETYAVTSDSWRLSLAFEGAWGAWDDRWKSHFHQVDTDLRIGLDGYIALTRADEKRRAICLYWDWTGLEYVIYARESFADADEVADLIDGEVPAAAWRSLAQELLKRLAR